MNEAYNNLLTRRSIRKYRPEQISRAELDAVLEAGKCAPSGRNMQSAIMIAVQDPETVALLSKLNAAAWGNGYDGDPFYGAPTVIVVLAKADSPLYQGGRQPCHGQPHECRSRTRSRLLLDTPRTRSF